jgi:hypothetical protein
MRVGSHGVPLEVWKREKEMELEFKARRLQLEREEEAKRQQQQLEADRARQQQELEADRVRQQQQLDHERRLMQEQVAAKERELQLMTRYEEGQQQRRVEARVVLAHVFEEQKASYLERAHEVLLEQKEVLQKEGVFDQLWRDVTEAAKVPGPEFLEKYVGEGGVLELPLRANKRKVGEQTASAAADGEGNGNNAEDGKGKGADEVVEARPGQEGMEGLAGTSAGHMSGPQSSTKPNASGLHAGACRVGVGMEHVTMLAGLQAKPDAAAQKSGSGPAQDPSAAVEAGRGAGSVTRQANPTAAAAGRAGEVGATLPTGAAAPSGSQAVPGGMAASGMTKQRAPPVAAAGLGSTSMAAAALAGGTGSAVKPASTAGSGGVQGPAPTPSASTRTCGGAMAPAAAAARPEPRRHVGAKPVAGAGLKLPAGSAAQGDTGAGRVPVVVGQRQGTQEEAVLTQEKALLIQEASMADIEGQEGSKEGVEHEGQRRKRLKQQITNDGAEWDDDMADELQASQRAAPASSEEM